MKTPRIYQLYRDLKKKHGSAEKVWPQWCATRKSLKARELIAIGAILTQRTSWHNADLALRNLKKAGLLSLGEIAKLPSPRRLITLTRPAGFYQTKPQRLFDLCSFIVGEYGGLGKFMKENPVTAREKLLALRGIGPETADTILLYAMDEPSFVIDEYTKRLFRRRGLVCLLPQPSPKVRDSARQARELNYDQLKELFEENLPCDVGLYQHFHALVIIEEKGLPGSIMKRV